MQEHAPLKKKKVKIIQSAPWFDSEYNNLRKLRRKAEKHYKRSKLSVDKDEFVRLCNQTTVLAYKKKRKYYEEKFKDNSSPKTLYAVVNKLLDNSPERILPTSTSDLELANSFMNYFCDKISKIRLNFPDKAVSTPMDLPTNVRCLSNFEKTTADEIRQIVLSHGIKCSPEDPVPANLLKNKLDLFIPIWVESINISFEQGSMEYLKNAVVLPLIKKYG